MKYFLDCGFYVGKALDYYAPLMDESWIVYAFEPNTELNVEESIKRFPFQVNWVKKAVWTEDGEVEFAIGDRNDASHISSLRKSPDRKVIVPCIDFSRFVAKLPEATIACSFDAEGAEFAVLRKMIDEGTIQRLSLLDIEFHTRPFEDKTEADTSLLRQEIESLGVLVKLKI